ncbi:MAG: alpha/beta fold hydrolase [bacterium]
MKSIKILFSIMLAVVVLFSGGSTFAQDLSKINGDWEGNLQAGGMNLKIVFHFTISGEVVSAKMDSPDQNAFGIIVDEVKINGDAIRMDVKSIGGTYEGQFDNEENLIAGDWKQGTGSYKLDLSKMTETAKQEKKEFISLWEGILKISAVELRLVLKIFENEDKTLGALLDSPDQGAKDIPVSRFDIDDDSLNFEISSIGGSYLSKYNKDSVYYEGTWKQSGMSLPLNIKHVDRIDEAKRPQNPQKPYPYNEEEVTFENKSEGIKLTGTFTFPKSGGEYPAVVLVTGSGPQDRDETIFSHKPFLVLSDYLTRNGIAVLRYDDRGIGQSTGDFSAATTVDFTSDAQSAIEYLRTRKEVNTNKIGIAGHSEGGLIAPMAASQSKDVKFIVMLAGPGVSGTQILSLQSKLILKAMGATDEEIEKAAILNEKLYNIIISEPDNEKAKITIMTEYNNYYNALSDEEKQEPGTAPDMFEKNLVQLLSPWFRFFLAYDPQPTLEELTIPVLAINGGKDLQVDPNQNLPEIEKALKNAGNKNFKTIELPGLNHLFQHTETGAISEYGQIEETMSPEVLKIISDWILNEVK